MSVSKTGTNDLKGCKNLVRHCCLPILFLWTWTMVPLSAQPPTYTHPIGMAFVRIDPGQMVVGRYQPAVGKPDDVSDSVYQVALQMAAEAARPGFPVRIERPYYIGKYEVTQQQWERVMGGNPSQFQSATTGQHPVENVTWEDAQAFVAKLNRLDRQHTYRLPTEFEWEWAARAGAEDDIAWTDIRRQAVLSGTSPGRVGQKAPNAWGLYDMLGNVWEWVQDYYNEQLFADPVPPTSGQEHVLKGASFTGDVKNATYLTHAAGPGNGFDVGFRVVMEIK